MIMFKITLRVIEIGQTCGIDASYDSVPPPHIQFSLLPEHHWL